MGPNYPPSERSTKLAKPERVMTECEYCGKLLDTQSPPLPEYYKRGQIQLGNKSSVLLDKPASEQIHCKFLDGRYCDLECLVAQIKIARGLPVSESCTGK